MAQGLLGILLGGPQAPAAVERSGEPGAGERSRLRDRPGRRPKVGLDVSCVVNNTRTSCRPRAGAKKPVGQSDECVCVMVLSHLAPKCT